MKSVIIKSILICQISLSTLALLASQSDSPVIKRGLQGGAGFGGHSDANPDSLFAERLGLSEEQKTKYLKQKAEESIQLQKLQAQLMDAQEKIGTLMKNNASKVEIMATFKQSQVIMNQIGEMNFASGLTLRDMLTPEQRARMTGMLMGDPKVRLAPTSQKETQHDHKHSHDVKRR
ncbi:hypothetical protein MEO40_26935 [Dolichospermum sp. ST_sed1]|nr:hypothetical protein [Dolichospermum sp. ST_sed1]